MKVKRDDFMKTMATLLDGLYAAAIRLTGSRAEAEDLVQETCLRAWKAWASFESGTNARAWMHRILVNGYISNYRRRARERRALDLGVDPGRRALLLTSAQEALEGAEGGVMVNRLGKGLATALDALPEEFRAVVVMSDIGEMSYRQIADALGCPMGTVMSRLHRGRRALARSLSTEGIDANSLNVQVMSGELPKAA